MKHNESVLNKRIGDAFDEDSFIKEHLIFVCFTWNHFGFCLPYHWIFARLEIDFKTLTYRVGFSRWKLCFIGIITIAWLKLMFFSGELLMILVPVTYLGLIVITYFSLHLKVRKELSNVNRREQKRPRTKS